MPKRNISKDSLEDEAYLDSLESSPAIYATIDSFKTITPSRSTDDVTYCAMNPVTISPSRLAQNQTYRKTSKDQNEGRHICRKTKEFPGFREQNRERKRTFGFQFLVLLAVSVIFISIIAFLGVTMATERMDSSEDIDLAEVQKVLEILKAENKEEKTVREKVDETWNEFAGEPTYRNELPDNIYEIEEDAETIEIDCCKSIRISSTASTKLFYPFLLGEYKMEKRESKKPIYVKAGQRTLYLSQPVSHSRVLGYSWGVSQTPEAKWGYVRSNKASACPAMEGQWMVYDRKINKWTKDITLSVKCGPVI